MTTPNIGPSLYLWSAHTNVGTWAPSYLATLLYKRIICCWKQVWNRSSVIIGLYKIHYYPIQVTLRSSYRNACVLATQCQHRIVYLRLRFKYKLWT